ncbi:hypothetical protein LINGRAHAP2_LOCUS9961 [Linum grandiflorum]
MVAFVSTSSNSRRLRSGKKEVDLKSRVVIKYFKLQEPSKILFCCKCMSQLIIKDALPTYGMENLEEEQYKLLTTELASIWETINSLNLRLEQRWIEVTIDNNVDVLIGAKVLSMHYNSKDKDT